MKKFLTFFAAVLMASSMMAQFDTWSVVGSKAIMNGTADWAITETANDMATEDGVTYTLTVTGKTLEVGTTYEYKYAKDHAWTVSVPQSGNLSLTVAETAVYDIAYSVNVSNGVQSAVATKAGEAGEITHVYSIAGSSADLFGAAWDQKATATEMTKGEDGIYSWTKEGVELAAVTIEFKVVVDHAWGEAYPAQNAKLVIAEAATYNVVVTFNPADKAVNATANKVGGEPGPGPEPEPEATIDTLYLVNSKGWGNPKLHLWDGTAAGTSWPGVAMVKVADVKADGFDVYMYSFNHGDYAKCIFNNGGSVQSGNLAIAGNEGKFFNFADQTWYESAEAVACTWYLNANYNGTTEWRELTRGEGFTRRDVYAPATNYYYNGMAADNLKSEIKGAKLTIDSNLAEGDSAVFTLDPYAKTINITKIDVLLPVITKDTAYYYAGTTTEWALTAMSYAVTLPKDSTIKYKLVREIITYADEVEASRDTTWYGAQNKDSYMTRESNAWALDGEYDVLLTTDAEGEYTFSLVAGVFTVTFPEIEVPEATKDTIYYVNWLSWEKVYVHAWEGTAAGTTWPGVEATKMAEQIKGYEVYMFEAETGAYAKCIFNNGNGTQSADLDWTAGKYYYNNQWLTLEELAEAGDPTEAQKADITIRVLSRTAPLIWWWSGDIEAAEKTYTWETRPAMPQEGETDWYSMTFENVNVDMGLKYILTIDGVQSETKTATESVCLNSSYEAIDCEAELEPEPKDPEYGIMVNGETFVAAVKNEEYTGEGEEWIVNVTFEGGELFQIYNKTTEAGWVIAQSTFSEKVFALTEEDDNFVVADAGEYTLYIKIIYNADEMYVAYNDPSVKHYDYYLVGTAAVDGWDVTKAMPMENDEITRSLEAGTYEFKIINATIIAGEDPSWSSALDYDDLNTECSSEGVEGSSNVKFTLKEAGDVTIKVVEGTICVTGNFGEVVITVYTIAGQEALMGVDWKVDATENDLTKGEDGLWRLMKTDVELMAETYYDFKVVANHAWGVADYPETDANRQIKLDKDGVYDIEFVWNAEEKNIEINPTWKRALSATNLEMLMQDGAVKVLRGGNLYILREGKIYNAAGLLVK